MTEYSLDELEKAFNRGYNKAIDDAIKYVVQSNNADYPYPLIEMLQKIMKKDV